MFPPELLPLPLHDCSQRRPPAFQTVTLLFPDGAVRIGYWSGEEWVTEGGATAPEQWQPLPEQVAEHFDP